jgi:hypothetical protein
LPERVSHDEVEMKVFINLGKEREGSGENKYAQSCYETEQQNQCALFAICKH